MPTYDINGNEIEPLTAEEFAAILWPGMFKPGWRDREVWFQEHCYCLNKAEELLKIVEVRYKK